MQAAPSGPHLNLINSASGPNSIYHHTGARASTWIFCCLVAQSCLTLCNPMDCSTPGLPVPHHLPEFAQAHAHCISDAVQPSHPLTPSSPSALSLSQHQGLFHWVICLHQMTKILELQLQHQSFQRILRVDLPWGWLVWSPCCPRDFQESSPAPQLEDIDALVFYLYSPALTTYMATGKTIARTVGTFAGRGMSLLFNTLSRFVIAFLPRSNHLISWLQSPSAEILEPKKRKSVTTSTFSPSICHAAMGPDAMPV